MGPRAPEACCMNVLLMLLMLRLRIESCAGRDGAAHESGPGASRSCTGRALDSALAAMPIYVELRGRYSKSVLQERGRAPLPSVPAVRVWVWVRVPPQALAHSL